MSSVLVKKKRYVLKLLTKGETLKWVGEPDPVSSILPLSHSFLAGFALTVIFTTISILFFKASSIKPNAEIPMMFIVMSLSFVTFSLVLLFDPLWKYFIAKKTIYVITNRRAIIVEGLFFLSVTSYGKKYKAINFIEIADRKGEFSDVIFDRKASGSVTLGESTLSDRDIGFKRLNNSTQIKRMLTGVR